MKAKEVQKLSIPALQKKVLEYFCFPVPKIKGLTCEEVEVQLNMKHQTVSPRIRELVQSGFLEITKQRRPTSSGRSARVYKVFPKCP